MNTIAIPPLVHTRHIVRPQFDVLYPVVDGLPNAAAQHAINQSLHQLMNATIASLSSPSGTDITGGYEIKTNQRGILSFFLTVYGFSGGAHGLTLAKSLTADTASGRSYTLGQLFKPNSDYTARLNALIREQIRARQIPVLREFTGISPDQDYYIADKALVIYFQLYDLTPYVYGFTYFPISVYSLADIVLEDGPLGRMMS